MANLLASRVVMISTLSAQLLSPPPFNYTPADLGVFTAVTMIGVILAYPIAGPLTDIMSRYLRKRNGGLHSPEHRFVTILFSFVISPTGLFVFGHLYADYQSAIGAAVGFTMQVSSLTIVPKVVLSYVIDVYPSTRSEVNVLVNAIFHVVSFGVALKTPQWLQDKGVELMFTQMACIELGTLALFLPWYIWGRQIREKTEFLRPRGVRNVE